MPNYRRNRTPGACYFFTLVTKGRRPILDHGMVMLLCESVREVRKRMPFEIDAWVVLPDHMHAIWRLPEGDSDYSKRWGLIKAGLSKRSGLSQSTAPGRDAGVWQARFWEHRIRDEEDWRRHMDYVHFNPVKHGLVSHASDWPHSTFHRLVEQGLYPPDWGVSESIGDVHAYGE